MGTFLVAFGAVATIIGMIAAYIGGIMLICFGLGKLMDWRGWKKLGAAALFVVGLLMCMSLTAFYALVSTSQ